MRGGNKYCGTKTHTLHIKDVDKSDNGSYQCLVKNGVRKELSEVAGSVKSGLQDIRQEVGRACKDP